MKPNMKNLICVTLLLASWHILPAQVISKELAKDLGNNIREYWEEADPDFNPNTIPEKWNNESAVMIAGKKVMTFDKGGGAVLRIDEKTHCKIKLNDNNSVKQYSELYIYTSTLVKHGYYNAGALDNGFAARVIKPNGSKIDVDILKAILVKEDPGSALRPFQPYVETINSVAGKKETINNVYKLAVPDLQVGDIIEYASIVRQTVDVKSNEYYEFDPIYYLCNREMPVMKHSLMVRTDSKSYVNSKSLNGAPEFKEVNDKDWNTYLWEDKDRERVHDIRYVNKYLVLPMVKFQVIFSWNGYTKKLFIGDKGELKKAFTPEELSNRVSRILTDMDHGAYSVTYKKQNVLGGSDGPSLIKWGVQRKLDEINAKKLTEDEYIKKLYYCFRNVALDVGKLPTSLMFAYVFMDKLKKKDIPCSLIITSRNDVTSPKDIVFRDEVEFLVKVKDRYVFNFSPFSNFADLNLDYAGNDAYIIDPENKIAPVKITLPNSRPDDNKSNIAIDVKFDKDLENLQVNTSSDFSGFNKEASSYLALAYTDALDNDFKTYGAPDPKAEMKKREREAAEKEMLATQEQNKKKKSELMKNNLKDDFSNIVSYDEFKLVSDGRCTDNPVLKYQEKYVLGDMLKKAGKNLLIGIPSLMGGQAQIGPEEKTRQYDIDTRYARTFHWIISFEIPAGYTPSALEELNTTVDNETGSFIASTKTENNKLVIDVKKVYKQKDVKKENWSKMMEFLEAAYNFSQKKLLLRKS